MEIKLAHSPDSDDAFMFYGLATQKVRSPGLKFTHVLADIETLNQAATQEIYDVTAFSFAAYPFLRDKYVLAGLRSELRRRLRTHRGFAASAEARGPGQMQDRRSRAAHFRLYGAETVRAARRTRCDGIRSILDAVKNSVVDAGLLIHEGQLFFSQMGLHKVVDLGQWWLEQTGLPLPLGGNGVRRALGRNVGLQIGRAIHESVSYALDHREAAVNYAMQFARDMDTGSGR